MPILSVLVSFQALSWLNRVGSDHERDICRQNLRVTKERRAVVAKVRELLPTLRSAARAATLPRPTTSMSTNDCRALLTETMNTAGVLPYNIVRDRHNCVREGADLRCSIPLCLYVVSGVRSSRFRNATSPRAQ